MNTIYAIIRYTKDYRQQVLYTSKEAITTSANEPLLSLIEAHLEQTFSNPQPFCQQLSLQENLFYIYFLPEKEEKTAAQQVLVVVQATEKLELQAQELPLFVDDLKLFFQKGAHDVKNLLSNLTLLLQKNMVDKAQTYLKELEHYYVRQTDDLHEAFGTFVNIRKPATPHIKKVAFQLLITDIVAPYQSLLAEDMTVETHFQACPHLTYREDFLQNMVKSLIDNAVRYRAEGRKLILRISTQQKGEHILFSVEDNGTGIDTTRYKDKLFVPFQRFTRRSNGQGISLHLIKVMVEKNGGSIALASTPDQGTLVVLALKEYTLHHD